MLTLRNNFALAGLLLSVEVSYDYSTLPPNVTFTVITFSHPFHTIKKSAHLGRMEQVTKATSGPWTVPPNTGKGKIKFASYTKFPMCK